MTECPRTVCTHYQCHVPGVGLVLQLCKHAANGENWVEDVRELCTIFTTSYEPRFQNKELREGERETERQRKRDLLNICSGHNALWLTFL